MQNRPSAGKRTFVSTREAGDRANRVVQQITFCSLFTVFAHQSSMFLSMLRRYLKLDGQEEIWDFIKWGLQGEEQRPFTSKWRITLC